MEFSSASLLQAVALSSRPRTSESSLVPVDGSAMLLQRIAPSRVRVAANDALAVDAQALLSQLQDATQSLQRVRAMAAAVAAVERLRGGAAVSETSKERDAVDEVETKAVALDALVGMLVGPRGGLGERDGVVEREEKTDQVLDGPASPVEGRVSVEGELVAQPIREDGTMPLHAERVERKDDAGLLGAASQSETTEELRMPSEKEPSRDSDGGHDADMVCVAEHEATAFDVTDGIRHECKDLNTQEARTDLPDTEARKVLKEREARKDLDDREAKDLERDAQNENGAESRGARKERTMKGKERDLSTAALEQSSFECMPQDKAKRNSVFAGNGSTMTKTITHTSSTVGSDRADQHTSVPTAQPRSVSRVSTVAPRILPSNLHTDARHCLSLCQRVANSNELKADLTELDSLAAHVSGLLRAVEKAHRAGCSFANCTVLGHTLGALRVVAAMIEQFNSATLANVRFLTIIRGPLQTSTNQFINANYKVSYEYALPAHIIALYLPLASTDPTTTSKLWLLLTFVAFSHHAAYNERCLAKLIPLFRHELSAAVIQQEMASPDRVACLPLTYLMLDVVVDVVVLFGRRAHVVELFNVLTETNASYVTPSEFLTSKIKLLLESVKSTSTPSAGVRIEGIDLQKRLEKIHANLRWYLRRRRRSQAAKEDSGKIKRTRIE